MPIDDSAQSNWLLAWFTQVGEETRPAEKEVQAWLSASEQERLQRIGHDRRRREYLLSRALMRAALSQRFERPAAGWRFDDRPGAPPRVEGLPAGISLGLSHSGGYVCFALANCCFGIDIEVVDPKRDCLATAGMFMDSRERERLADDAARRLEFFYRAWCAKEACYKSLAPDEQKTTSLRAISYARLRSGQSRRRLIEGEGGNFRIAAVMACDPVTIETFDYQVPVPVTIGQGMRSV